MLTIRSITLQLPHSLLVEERFESKNIENFFINISEEFNKNNISIRTKRINIDPINDLDDVDKFKILSIVKKIDNICKESNIRWFNIPFNLVNSKKFDIENISNIILEIIKNFPNSFVNNIVADDKGINLKSIDVVSNTILKIARLDNKGFNNFRIGVSANVSPNTPFFPFTYAGNELGFSIGLEITQEIFDIAKQVKNLEELRSEILKEILPQLVAIQDIAEKIEKKCNMKYFGVDTSLAPYPEEKGSVAELIQNIGVSICGSNGTLFITSFLTDILKSFSNIKTVGFCGVMFSVLEDEYLSISNANKNLSIDALISYAAVCGCGIDMIPLPSDIFKEEISSLILDISALAIRLKKPLGVRVLPIPNKKTNEFTDFNMDFLYNTRVVSIKNHFFNNFDKNSHFNYIKGKNIIY